MTWREIPPGYKSYKFLVCSSASPFPYIQTEYIPQQYDEFRTSYIAIGNGVYQSLFYAGTGSYQLGMTFNERVTAVWFKYFATGNAPRATSLSDNTLYTVLLTKDGSLYINGVYKGKSPYDQELDGDQNAKRLRLFLRSNNDSPLQHGKIGRFTVINEGTNKLDLIPCKRLADGVCGMWDTVAKKFLTSASTGVFTVSND